MADIVKNQDGTVVVTVTVDGDAWKNEQKKAFRNLKSRVSMKGFRKGHVPDSYAQKMISADSIIEAALNPAVQKAYNEVLENDEIKDLSLLDRPSVDVKDADENAVTMVFTFVTEPEAEVSNYKNLGVEKEEVSVTDEEVDKAVQNLLSRNADWVLVEDDTPVKEGDKVHISFVQTGEGADDEREEEDLIVGDQRLFKDFEDQLIGMKTNETKNVHIVYPDNYVAREMQGQAADYDVTVTEIHYRDVPELTDETVAELEIPETATVEELKTRQKETLKNNKEHQAEDKYIADLLDAVAKNTTVELPSVMIDRETDRMFQDFARQIQQNGFSVTEFIESAGTSPEALKEGFRGQAEDNLIKTLALKAIIKAENIAVTDEEAEAELDKLVEATQMDKETLKKAISLDALRNQILDQKVIEYLKSVQ